MPPPYHAPSRLFADQAVVSSATMDRLDPTASTQVVLVRGGSEQALNHPFADVPGVKVMDKPHYVKTAAGAMTKGMRVVYGFIGMALVLALFGKATTVSMSVSERTRECGLLGAVGATMAQIRAIVRWEAATVVLLGSSVHCVALGVGPRGPPLAGNAAIAGIAPSRLAARYAISTHRGGGSP
ncbi:ABC transporter permease [Actinomadura darangshiensis]|uniref:ABC transporter permease n=1 Tax=Actinomadura darangshiensis TaxID=705336 RepID=A0A4R5A537_9ACTN|nr:ABC transporter permease [Actinomadura darangshiensis]TDD65819.1 ABC transporter permease [Actinomadura darangshiensis]